MAYVINPPIPYSGSIGALQRGGIIQIIGRVPPHAKRFAINLQCGPNTNPRDDIAVQINPRFEGNVSKVVLNSLQSEEWGIEQNVGRFPFTPGQQFELRILMEPDCFKIAVNGQHYTEFKHRIPVQRVTTIGIDGDVQIFTIRYQRQLTYQDCRFCAMVGAMAVVLIMHELNRLGVPYLLPGEENIRDRQDHPRDQPNPDPDNPPNEEDAEPDNPEWFQFAPMNGNENGHGNEADGHKRRGGRRDDLDLD